VLITPEEREEMAKNKFTLEDETIEQEIGRISDEGVKSFLKEFFKDEASATNLLEHPWLNQTDNDEKKVNDYLNEGVNAASEETGAQATQEEEQAELEEDSGSDSGSSSDGGG